MNFPGSSTYAASKSALLAFTNSLQLEIAGTGVSTLTLITPGIKTEMFDSIEEKYQGHMKIDLESISPEEYAEQIEIAILKDEEILYPGGATGLGLIVAKYFQPIFKYAIGKKFQR